MILKFSEFVNESLSRKNTEEAERFLKLIDEPFKVYHDINSEDPDGVVDFGEKGHFFYGFDPVSRNPNGSREWPLWLLDYYETPFNPNPHDWEESKDGALTVQQLINALN